MPDNQIHQGMFVNRYGRSFLDDLNTLAQSCYSFEQLKAAIVDLIARPILDPHGGSIAIALGKITAVTGSGTGPANGTGPTLKYSATSYAGASLSVENVTPYLIPFGTMDVIAAQVNDDCLMFQSHDTPPVTRLIVWTEKLATSDCATGSGAGASNGSVPTFAAPVIQQFGGQSAMQRAGYSAGTELDYLLSRIPTAGVATLDGSGLAVISNAGITVESVVHVTSRNSGVRGVLFEESSARNPGVDFTVGSREGATDAGYEVGWTIIEP